MGAIKGWKRKKENEWGLKIRWWNNVFSPRAYVFVHKQPSGRPAKWGVTVFGKTGQEEMSIHDLRGRADTQKEAIAKAIKWMRKHPRG